MEKLYRNQFDSPLMVPLCGKMIGPKQTLHPFLLPTIRHLICTLKFNEIHKAKQIPPWLTSPWTKGGWHPDKHFLQEIKVTQLSGASQVVLMINNPPANAGDIRNTGSIPASGRSPGGEHDNSLQYSCLQNPMTGEPGGLQSMGSQIAGHNWVTEHNK